MKKFLTLLFLILFFNLQTAMAEQEIYTVLKVVDGDTVYIDFNQNGIADADEKARINGIDTFETTISDKLNQQMITYKLNPNEALGLGFYAKEYAKNTLLNKPVIVEHSALNTYDNHKRHLVSVYYNEGKKTKNYSEEVLKEGLAVVHNKSNLAEELKSYENSEKMKKHIKASHNLNLVLLNRNTNKYHHVNCKNIKNSNNLELVDEIPSNAAKAKCCN